MNRSLLDIELKIDGSKPIREVTNGDINRLLASCHPDRFPDDAEDAKTLFQRVSNIAEAVRNPKRDTVKSPKRMYELLGLMATGDVADVYFSGSGDHNYVTKISRINGAHDLLEAERRSLVALHTTAGDTTYRLYFPLLAESFPVRDAIQKRVNVFTAVDGYHPLLGVMKRYPDGLVGRHAVWIFKRLLTAIGFAHKCGIIHGAIVPEHILVDNVNRGIMLIGWGQSVEVGNAIKVVSKGRKDYYPPEVFAKKPASPETDLYMAAKCVLGIATVDTEKPIMSFLKSCTMEGQFMRPDNAWAVFDEFTDLLKKVYGEPQFCSLEL